MVYTTVMGQYLKMKKLLNKTRGNYEKHKSIASFEAGPKTNNF
jgi:hypothetical protein